MSEMKILDSYWFSSLDGQCIGIVLAQPKFGPPKAYIGVGQGVNQEQDEALIASMGGKYPSYAANALFRRNDIGD